MITLIICLFFTMSIDVSAVGIAPAVKNLYVASYEDADTATFRVRVIKDLDEPGFSFRLLPSCSLRKYIEIDQSSMRIENDEKEKRIYFSIDIDRLNELAPGKHEACIKFIQVPEENSINGFATSTILTSKFIFNVPKEGKFVKSTYNIEQQGKSAVFEITVENLGKEDIEELKTEIDIEGITTNLSDNLLSNPIGLEAGSSTRIVLVMDDIEYGRYDSAAKVNYDGIVNTHDMEFDIDMPDLSIEDIHLFRKKNSLSFELIIKNNHDKDIENVCGEIDLLDEKGSMIKKLKTDCTNIRSKKTSTLRAVWDYPNSGKFNLKIKLKAMNSVIIEERLIEIAQLDAIKAKIEVPKTLNVLFFIAIMMLIIVDIIVKLGKKKQDKNVKKKVVRKKVKKKRIKKVKKKK